MIRVRYVFEVYTVNIVNRVNRVYNVYMVHERKSEQFDAAQERRIRGFAGT
jgi:hypothetical protein